jgi:SAM-dependent methyltransferase
LAVTAESLLLRRLSRLDDYDEILRLYPSVPRSIKLYFALRFLVCPFRRVESVVPRSGIIVDIGCGYGLFANLLAVRSGERHVIGCDPDASRIKMACSSVGRRSNISFSVSKEVAALPRCDVVTLVDVLHHIASDARLRLLEEIFRQLKPGGNLVVKDIDKTPRAKYLWNYLHDFVMTRGARCHYLGSLEMCRLLEQMGFLVVAEPLKTRDPYSHILYRCTKPGRAA